MGLASVTQKALSGIAAAQTAVSVIANNLANANTDVGRNLVDLSAAGCHC